ncbi:acyltransferase family protein [Cognatilysobacter terrigena]|uniref:acyltransferase family protein n=1 Tax=Cognatilysobacter terrigena TaxID=2488749 RepID=UPI0010603EBB|nr:acyltransferase family protein [Lysobacter terrigena]
MAVTPKPGFRPDIEGLRALAIVLVVACHAGLPGFAGGFIGVDVFFVISGYVITRLLVSEWAANGRVDFTAFYARRARRLVPALLLMLGATGFAAAVLLAPWEQSEQSVSITAAALWISNIRFALADLDYFAPEGASNVVLHTWSLGVEEQFYLVWPAWLLACLGAWSWQRRNASTSQLLASLSATLPIALFLAAAMTVAAPRLGFYMMPARFWQFTVGALVYAAVDERRRTAGPRAAAFVGVVGCASIGLACALIDSRTSYPSPWSLAPTLGAALLLAAGSLAPGNAVSNVLSTRAGQAIGRLSYGWYLWHWPLLVLGSGAVIVPSVSLRIALSLAALGLAAISYRLVERPLRRPDGRRAGQLRSLATAVSALLAVALGAYTWAQHVPRWMHIASQQRIEAARTDIPSIYGKGCDDWYNSDRLMPCIDGDRHAPHTAVVLGDSVALQWYPALAKVFAREGWRLIVLTKSSCPAADIDFVYERIGRRYDECTRWRRAALDYVVHATRADLVLIGSSAAYPFSRTEWSAGTRSVLASLAPATPRIYVIRPTPMLGFDGLACLGRLAWRPEWLRSAAGCSVPMQHASAFDGVRDAIAAYPTVRIVDLDTDVCPNGRCSAYRDGRIAYRDGMHLTASFAQTFEPQFRRALEPGIRDAEGQPVASR